MPPSAKTAALVDTSVAVAMLVSDHDHHRETIEALDGTALGLAGHAAFETFSVLTRVAPPIRKTPATVARLLANTFPETRFLGTRRAAALLAELETLGIAGGAVFDALVAATADEHRLTLISRDRRALVVYRTLEVDVELLA